MDSTRSNIFVPKKSSTDNWIPEGFVVLIGPDNEKYVVPEFMVDKIDQDYRSQEKKKELKASSAPGTVSFFFTDPENVRHEINASGLRPCY